MKTTKFSVIIFILFLVAFVKYTCAYMVFIYSNNYEVQGCRTEIDWRRGVVASENFKDLLCRWITEKVKFQ